MLSRRVFLGLFSKATLAVAAAQIPFVSAGAQKIASCFGWISITVNGERWYIPFWN